MISIIIPLYIILYRVVDWFEHSGWYNILFKFALVTTSGLHCEKFEYIYLEMDMDTIIRL